MAEVIKSQEKKKQKKNDIPTIFWLWSAPSFRKYCSQMFNLYRRSTRLKPSTCPCRLKCLAWLALSRDRLTFARVVSKSPNSLAPGVLLLACTRRAAHPGLALGCSFTVSTIPYDQGSRHRHASFSSKHTINTPLSVTLFSCVCRQTYPLPGQIRTRQIPANLS